MRKILVVVWSLTFMLAGCKREQIFQPEEKGRKADLMELARKMPQKPLVQIYYEHGNFVNQQDFPPVVPANQVLKHYREWLVIDLRRSDDYAAGHIPGVYNVPKDKVLDFLKNRKKAARFPKVVFVCYSGQTASYVSGITRYAGFDNTYAMLFGMAAWNKQFSAPLEKGVGDRYPQAVETGESQTLPVGRKEKLPATVNWNDFPQIKGDSPSALINQRAQKLLEAPRTDFLLKADEFFPEYLKNPSGWQPVCYLPKDKFLAGHIRGSRQFTPRHDLSPDGKLSMLPQDKNILIYCKSGHTGGHAAAYLDMIGYRAQNLILGSMSFIYGKWKANGWAPPVEALINDFPVVEGGKPYSGKPVQVAAPKTTPKAALPAVKHKKKEVTGGCG